LFLSRAKTTLAIFVYADVFPNNNQWPQTCFFLDDIAVNLVN